VFNRIILHVRDQTVDPRHFVGLHNDSYAPSRFESTEGSGHYRKCRLGDETRCDCSCPNRTALRHCLSLDSQVFPTPTRWRTHLGSDTDESDAVMAHCLVAGIRPARWSRIGEGLQIFERMAQSLTRRTRVIHGFRSCAAPAMWLGIWAMRARVVGYFVLISVLYIYFYINSPRPFNVKYANREP
jgi:hypothetical protein